MYPGSAHLTQAASCRKPGPKKRDPLTPTPPPPFLFSLGSPEAPTYDGQPRISSDIFRMASLTRSQRSGVKLRRSPYLGSSRLRSPRFYVCGGRLSHEQQFTTVQELGWFHAPKGGDTEKERRGRGATKLKSQATALHPSQSLNPITLKPQPKTPKNLNSKNPN